MEEYKLLDVINKDRFCSVCYGYKEGKGDILCDDCRAKIKRSPIYSKKLRKILKELKTIKKLAKKDVEKFNEELSLRYFALLECFEGDFTVAADLIQTCFLYSVHNYYGDNFNACDLLYTEPFECFEKMFAFEEPKDVADKKFIEDLEEDLDNLLNILQPITEADGGYVAGLLLYIVFACFAIDIYCDISPNNRAFYPYLSCLI